MEQEPSGPDISELEKLDDDELARRYHELVGKDPKFRALNRAQLIAGASDPKAELERLGQIDKEEDTEELRQTYRR